MGANGNDARIVATVKPGEASTKFKMSRRLYAERRFPEALALLEQLDAAFPDTKNVLYPHAMCLAALGRLHEARPLCERLVSKHADPRAQELLGLIAEGLTKTNGTGPWSEDQDGEAVESAQWHRRRKRRRKS
jgi:thioredoxin-like negative regulator of GroEL